MKPICPQCLISMIEDGPRRYTAESEGRSWQQSYKCERCANAVITATATNKPETDSDRERLKLAHDRYMTAAHGVQSGVKMRLTLDRKAIGEGAVDPETIATSTKHLRTGLDLQKAEAGGLVRLLIDRGLISEVDYLEAMAEAAEDERRSYERLLTEKIGKKVTLA